ncbi:MAG: acyl--CoA ligase [Actinomycetota bacterium]|nr:acyl--CoA ligase [Actinomycetota bacterium]
MTPIEQVPSAPSAVKPLLAPTLQAACERWADRTAVVHNGRRLSYAELWQRVNGLAATYHALGIRPGDRIVSQLPTCPEHLIAIHAAWACGAIHVGADKDLTGPELTALVERTEAAAVVFQPPPGTEDPIAPLRAVTAVRPGIVAIVHGDHAEAPALSLSALLDSPPRNPPPPPPPAPRDTDLLLLTSGTTGRPKAVMETLPALWAKVAFFADALAPGPHDVHLMYLPICHAFGLKLSLMALASGGRLVLLDRFSPQEALRLVSDEQVTVLPGSPTHLTLLLEALDPSRHLTTSLRWVVTAAAPLPPDVLEQVYARLGVEVLFVYGCSEGFVTLTSDREEIRRGSVGRTVFRGPEGTPPNGALAILDVDDDRRLPPEEVGVIAFGASRPVRYWGQQAVATDGWYRTGDLGWVDEDGRLFVTGRLKDVVNRGGLKVSPSEVEAALAHHPGVADCAVIPTPDPVLGEAICACIVPADPHPPSLIELRSYLGASLARHKLPDELCVVDMIPRSKVGKLDRDALRAAVLEAQAPRERFRERPGAAVTPSRA